MRFMMLMIPKGYETAAPGTMPDAKAVAAMMEYNEALRKAGVLITLDGLHPPSMGARVSFSGGKPMVTDGPFAEAKEVLGGYWMIQVKSKEEAIEWQSAAPPRTTRSSRSAKCRNSPISLPMSRRPWPSFPSCRHSRGGRRDRRVDSSPYALAVVSNNLTTSRRASTPATRRR